MMGMQEKIVELEKNYNITILYACEAGSRSYGLASPSSDYDLRFLYIYPLEHYLSLIKKEDTISASDDDLDIHGWDLQKALLLASKSNPTLFEWLQSPIIYKAPTPTISELMQLVQKKYCKKTLSIHYLNMAKKNITAYQTKNTPSYLIHAVRAALMAEQLLMQAILPRLELEELLSKSSYFSNEDLSFLFDLKNNPNTTRTGSFLHRTATHLRQLETIHDKKKRSSHTDLQELNRLFLMQLGMEERK